MGDDNSAADVFAVLSDETRVDVLRAVAVTQNELQVGGGPPRLSFSDIYERVDVDNTSKLSYHLGELTGTFLRKDDDGYSFTHAGENIVRFILAANYEEPREFGPMPVEGVCPSCGEDDLKARPNHQMLLVECSDCGQPASAFDIPPAQARDRDGEQLIRSIKQRYTAHYRQVHQGTCPECTGSLSTTVLDLAEMSVEGTDHEYAVSDECESCLRRYNAPLSYSVAYHPASVAFHWDHGIDITSTALWEFHEYARDGAWTAEKRASDPAEYVVELRQDEDMLRLYLDAAADVTRTERVRRHSGAGSQ
jgi:hypothetical protein